MTDSRQASGVWLCRLGLHLYRHQFTPIPAGTMPEPTNQFELSRFERVCSRCGRTKRAVV